MDIDTIARAITTAGIDIMGIDTIVSVTTAIPITGRAGTPMAAIATAIGEALLASGYVKLA